MLSSFSVLILALSMVALPSAIAQSVPKETTLAASGDPLLNGVARAVGERAFGKYGIKLILKDFPKERALVHANSGAVDGDAYRVVDFHQRTNGKFGNLVRINIPYMAIVWTAFVTDKLKDAEINGWGDMKSYRVAGIRGNKLMESRMKESLPKSNRIILTRYSQAFGMLLKGRVDIVVGKPNVGTSYLKKHKNLVAKGRFEVQDLYFYLHKKHRNLIPKLEAALRSMQSQGLLAKIEQDVRVRLNTPPVRTKH